MAHPGEYNAIEDVVKLLADDGFDALGEAIRRIINEVFCALSGRIIWVLAPTNVVKHGVAMPMGTNPRLSRPVSERLILTFPKLGTAASTLPV